MYYEEFGSSLNRSLLLSPPNQSRPLPISIMPKSGKPDFGGEKTEMRGAGRSSKLVAALTPTLSLAGEREVPRREAAFAGGDGNGRGRSNASKNALSYPTTVREGAGGRHLKSCPASEDTQGRIHA